MKVYRFAIFLLKKFAALYVSFVYKKPVHALTSSFLGVDPDQGQHVPHDFQQVVQVQLHITTATNIPC